MFMRSFVSFISHLVILEDVVSVDRALEWVVGAFSVDVRQFVFSNFDYVDYALVQIRLTVMKESRRCHG